MSLPTSAQQIADFVTSWNDFQIAIANGAAWSYKCLDLSAKLIADPNFATILTPAQQTWVTQCNTFFNALPSQMPTQPTG